MEAPEALSKCYFFNSFFYKKLTEKASRVRGSPEGKRTQPQMAHMNVWKWTKVITHPPPPSATLLPSVIS